MNMVNFLDGLDGLAAGVCAISALSFCVIDLSLGRADAAILTAIVFGACLGFLRHNFYPARIFMGDSGALLLGFTLAAVSVQGLLEDRRPGDARAAAARARGARCSTRRSSSRSGSSTASPIYVADRAHLHHRFENIGFSQRRAVVYLYGWCATLALAALATRFVHPHPHGDWDASNVALDAAVGLLALGASVYVVYLLEIVKLANPRSPPPRAACQRPPDGDRRHKHATSAASPLR